MYKIFRAEERGRSDYGWLKPNYYFSFANYYNSSRMGFGSLRVINDDWVAPGAGFPTHPHHNMEIITIPLEGGVAHKDSTGGEGVIRSGEVQTMTAGKGITHSEFNASSTEHIQLFQIWIEPSELNLTPKYQQQPYKIETNQLSLLVDGIENTPGVLPINQHACIWRGKFDGGKINYKRRGKNTGIFFILIDGELKVGNDQLRKRDWIELTEGDFPELEVVKPSDVLLIETV